MPSPSEQFSQAALGESRTGIVTAVVDKLREQRRMLGARGIISRITPPEPDWEGLAQEAINQRTLAGISLTTLYDSEGRSIDSLMPNPQKVESIAQEVSAGVAENTGSIGFLKGATIGQAFRGFWEMIKEKGIGAAISGVFNMIFGDGQSDDAKDLTKFIGGITASDIGKGITERLRNRPDLGMTEEQINEVSIKAQNTVRAQVGLPEISVPTASPAAPVVLGADGLTVDESQTVRRAIRAEVLTTLGLRQEGNDLVPDPANAVGVAKLNSMAAAAGVDGNQFNPEQRAAVVESMTNALHSTVTANPPLTTAQDIQRHIKNQLATNTDAMGLSGMTPEGRDNMLELMANQMTAAYMKSRPVDMAAGQAFERDTEARNAELTRLLIVGRTRPAILNGLGLQETAPGTFTVVERADGQKTQFEMLQQVAGADHPLDNAKRNAIVTTMSDALAHVAGNNITDPSIIRDEFKRRLEAKATEMGFGHLSAEDRNRLFTLMANQSTASYLEKAVSPQAATEFANAKRAENTEMTNQLMAGRIRPVVISGLNLAENPPGTFGYADPPPGKESAIKKLEQLVGRPLDNAQRTALVNTMSGSLQTVAQAQPPMTIEQARDHIQEQLSANADAMGFGALSEDERTKLFRSMANESTVSAMEQLNLGTAAERTAFKDAAQTENEGITRELTPGAVRRNLENTLNPNTAEGRQQLNMLTLATNGGTLNRDATINALTPVMTEITNTEPRMHTGVMIQKIEAALRNANPPTGIAASNINAVATAMAERMANPNAPAAGTPGSIAVGDTWKKMIDGLKRDKPDMHAQLSSAMNLDGVRDNIAGAIDNVMRDNPDFHSKTPDERSQLLRAAIDKSLREGSIPDGPELNMSIGPGVGAAIQPSVARNALTNIIMDRMNGGNTPAESFMPRQGQPGVRLTGMIGGQVQDIANIVGPHHLQNLDTSQIQGIATDIRSGNLSSGLDRAKAGVISVIDYWTR